MGQLNSLNDETLFCWFSIDYLPGVKDIDLFIVHKDAGLFSVEIKAIPLKLINTISLNYIDIRGRGKKENPNLQAYNAATSLRDYAYASRSINLPFIVATSCWPKITASEWKFSFKDDDVIADLANRMLMGDDLTTPKALRTKLLSIYTNPPIRGGSNRGYSFKHEHKEIIDSLCIAQNISPNIPVQSKFQVLVNSHKNNIKKKYPVGTTGKYRFSGVPGSGKTFALMQLAYAYGKEGFQVLFLCFNKVLASQIRAEFISLAIKENDPELTEFIIVQDVFEHASIQSHIHGIEGLAFDSHSEWISLLLDEIEINVSKDEEFPTILLVDETQDFQPEFISWIKFWSKKSSLIAVAEGVGQELYEPQELEGNLLEWWADFDVEKLNKNYRNPSYLYKVAFLLASSRLAIPNLQLAMSRLSKSIDEKTLQLLRTEERGLEIIPYSDQFKEKDKIAYFTEIIASKILELNERNKNLSDLLIVTRGRTAQLWILLALQHIKNKDSDFSFVNYIDPKNRRVTPSKDSVRVCTFESCRGLESEECIVVGLESLPVNLWHSASLALVALSRALTKTTVIVNQLSGHKLLLLLHELFDVIDSNNAN